MLETWDLGNYYTVGGSGRVISKNPVSGGSGVGGPSVSLSYHVLLILDYLSLSTYIYIY